MFKLVVLFALVAVALAKPGHLHGGFEVAAPLIAKTYVSPAAVSSTYREDIISKPAITTYAAAPIVTKAIVAEPVAVAAPVITKTVVAPAAVSHTYREDIISKPTAVAYAAPAVAYAAPAVSYAAPAVSYAAPAVSYAAPAAVSHSYRSDFVNSPVYAKTLVAPSAYSYAAHAPTVYAAHAPTVYAAHAPTAYAYAPTVYAGHAKAW